VQETEHAHLRKSLQVPTFFGRSTDSVLQSEMVKGTRLPTRSPKFAPLELAREVTPRRNSLHGPVRLPEPGQQHAALFLHLLRLMWQSPSDKSGSESHRGTMGFSTLLPARAALTAS
jgi:hypothetical protein